MDDEQRRYLRGNLSQCVVEFFEDYGVAFPSSAPGAGSNAPPSRGTEIEMGSVVGFKGQNIRGGLAFVAPTDFVARMLPVPKEEGRSDLQLLDWSGEIANQIAGRFKNKLASREFDFDVGAAASFRGKRIRVSIVPGGDGMSVTVSMPAVGIRVYLDCSFADGGIGVMGTETPEEDCAVREGDVVVF